MGRIRIGLNGYGRIGRCFHRQILDSSYLELVAINKTSPIQPELFKYDSVYGRIENKVRFENGVYTVDGREIKVYHEKDIGRIPWDNLDIVIDSTGKFKDYSSLEKHLAGAGKVILTAPPKDAAIKQFVIGVNESDYSGEKIISNASCTTNALAPILNTVDEFAGIQKASFLTIHSVTSSQNILDNSQKDIRRARAAYESIIPTTTGASKAVEQILPSLQGKLQGYAVRVPTSKVSMLDITLELEKETDDILSILETCPENIVRICYEKLVSVDFKGDPHSSIIDAEFTHSKGNRAKVLAWYDNEWGYTARLVDLARHIA